MAGVLVWRGWLLRESLLGVAALRLSVVIAGSSPGGPPTGALEGLMPHLADRTVELILATARPEPLGGDDRLPSGVRVLRFPRGTTVPRLRSLGLQAAEAELVALTEDFCVPADAWVNALLTAHEQHHVAAVGGPMDRLRGTPGQWALTFCEYGRFFGSRPEGPGRDLPGANVCYRVPRLRQVFGAIPEEFEEWRIHTWLRQKGEVLWWEPRMVMLDERSVSFNVALVSLYHHGRLFGGRRVLARGFWIRLARALLAPVVPPLQLARIAARVLPGSRSRQMIVALPLIMLLLSAWALGEGVGSLAGEGTSGQRWQ